MVPSSGRQDAALGLHAWLLRERASVRVGEIARFAVGSAIDGQALWLGNCAALTRPCRRGSSMRVVTPCS